MAKRTDANASDLSASLDKALRKLSTEVDKKLGQLQDALDSARKALRKHRLLDETPPGSNKAEKKRVAAKKTAGKKAAGKKTAAPKPAGRTGKKTAASARRGGMKLKDETPPGSNKAQ